MACRSGESYSADLCERVLAAVDGGGLPHRVSDRFGVSFSFIYKALKRRRLTGETTARAQRNRQALKLAAQHAAIWAEVERQPDLALPELCAWVVSTHDIVVSQGLDAQHSDPALATPEYFLTLWNRLGFSYWAVCASRFGPVREASLDGSCTLYRFAPRPRGGDERSHRLESHGAEILALIDETPDITLAGIVAHLQQKHGLAVAPSTVWRLLDRHGLSFKATAHAAEQQRTDVWQRRLARLEAQPE